MLERAELREQVQIDEKQKKEQKLEEAKDARKGRSQAFYQLN